MELRDDGFFFGELQVHSIFFLQKSIEDLKLKQQKEVQQKAVNLVDESKQLEQQQTLAQKLNLICFGVD